MPFWQRLSITFIAMLAASFILGVFWRSLFNIPLPSYLAGIIGGLSALPVWELLKRIKPKEEKTWRWIFSNLWDPALPSFSNMYKACPTFSLSTVFYREHRFRSYLKKVFWPNFFVGASFKILEILQYACVFDPQKRIRSDGESGFAWKLGPAANLNQNPFFEMASINCPKSIPSHIRHSFVTAHCWYA